MNKNKRKHANVPIFIPHLGCPNECVFCNQRKISGKTEYSRESVEGEIEAALSTIDRTQYDIEIAFFGGSFTGIDRDEMIWLLDKAQSYIDAGRADSIRLSTRPDYIDGEIIDILKSYSVKTVELGIQSTSDTVLAASKRGHTKLQSVNAVNMLKNAGFAVIGQMMTGLPASTLAEEIETAKTLCDLSVEGARIYSTVVFYDTELKDMAEKGLYIPLDDGDAIMRAGEVLSVFAKSGIDVIRIGLCATDNLISKGTIYGGSYHSAFGELVENHLYLKLISEKLPRDIRTNRLIITVPMGHVSKAVGQKRANINTLCEKFEIRQIKVAESPDLCGYSAQIMFE